MAVEERTRIVVQGCGITNFKRAYSCGCMTAPGRIQILVHGADFFIKILPGLNVSILVGKDQIDREWRVVRCL